MNWEEFQKFVKGKVILIGINFFKSEEELIEQYQTHGTIESVTDQGVFRILKDDGSLFQIPYDPDCLWDAEEGNYTEHSTGIVISNPDLITTWNLFLGETHNIEDVKNQGYIPD